LSTRLEGADWGLLLDSAKRIRFSFDGREHIGYAGDTIASALMASGRSILSRSFKYHRPRGVLTMAGHDANSLVQVGPEPNVRGDRHAITPDMQVCSVNRLGSLDHDLLAALGLLSPFLPVGFYYKTFFRPQGAWKWFERPIRALAGHGKLDPTAPHVAYDKAYLFCDVLVVGGGPAGLEAAIAAADCGADTILIDEWPVLGGSLLFGRVGGSRQAAEAKRRCLFARAEAATNLRILTDTIVTGLFGDNWASALRGARLFKIRAKEVVLATGGYDQPLIFANNDRPGVMFADAAQRLLRLYGVRPGRRAVVATANRFGYDAALDLLDAGVAVAAVVDLNVAQGPESDQARARGVRVISESILVDTRGRRRVKSVAVTPARGEGRRDEKEWIDCDLVLMSVGYAPALNLASHAGARIQYDAAIAMHRARDLPPGLSLTGAVAGIWSDVRLAADAKRVGAAAAAAALGCGGGRAAEMVFDEGAEAITHPWPIAPSSRGKDFVDFDEDLQTRDIVNSVRLGYDDIQLVKRYSTVGLGSSQGRHANLNTIRIVARETGVDLETVGTTTFRPPLVPEKFAHMAGRAFEPTRLTPMHGRHLERGARMMPAGLWLRPAYYGARSAATEAITREVRAVRRNVGLIDVTTLGRLEIRGRDASAFLERMYTGGYAKQPIARARYALMTDQTGVVVDDGVAFRMHERHFFVTATTSGVDAVYRLMTWWNQHWRMEVDIANVTAAYAGLNVAGPRAREVLWKLDSDIDFSAGAFPYMGVRQGNLAGMPVRIARVGFVGELGFEIHCPSGMGEAMWDALMAAGDPFDIAPFGVEAQRVLRLEKGHIIVGQDTDGLTNPLEASLEWAIAKAKPFFVGKRAIEILAAKGVTRRLVGFTLLDGRAPCPKECCLVIREGAIAGRVTSAVRSPSLDCVIGLAYVPADLSVPGSRFEIRVDRDAITEAIVTQIPFYDRNGERQEM
jgi:sarcosine oxidase subunit alpha